MNDTIGLQFLLEGAFTSKAFCECFRISYMLPMLRTSGYVRIFHVQLIFQRVLYNTKHAEQTDVILVCSIYLNNFCL